MDQDKTNRDKAIGKLVDLSRPKLHRRLPSIAAAAVLIVGLFSTLVITQLELRHIEREDQQHFDQLAERIRTEVTRRVRLNRYGLMGTRSTFVASTYVDHAEFNQLAGARELDSEFPGTIGLGYIELVPDDDEQFNAFVSKTRQEGVEWFEVKTPPGSEALAGSQIDGRMIVKYVEPLSANRNALGLDIGAHPIRRVAAEKAAIQGDGCLTEIIYLVQDEKRVPGFLYLLPHYEAGKPVDTAEQRIDALLGWVYMAIIGPDLFEGIGEIAEYELDIEIYGDLFLTEDTLVHDTDPSKQSFVTEGLDVDKDSETGLSRTVPFVAGGNTWTLALHANNAFQYASRSEIWTTGLTGGVLSIMFALLVYMQGTSSRKAWALAEGMTADLRDYAARAEQATAAKTDFLANMSHEIRTPMTAILGFTDLLRTQIDQDNEELLGHTTTIKRNGEHLLSLINDILDMSKIEAGKLDIEQIAVQPDAVVREVLSLMQVKADEKNLPLNAQLLTPIPREILGDPVRLRQILVNLVGNAIKFTKHGGVSIEVRYDEIMEELKFAVIDTGVGMTQEQVSRLFGAFEQADTTTTREFGGTGLGLHISQRLATMLGGNIVCNSVYGQGSTFTLTVYTSTVDTGNMIPEGFLEEAADDTQANSQGSQSETKEVKASNPLDGMKILLAEDGKDNQRLIGFHLKKAGAEVTIVENGKLAVEALTVNGGIEGPLLTPPPFDVLLTDMQMPEMDGYTEVCLLRKLGSTMPIVALTAHAMKEDVNKCIDAGCDYYASKPINKDKLIQVCLDAASRNKLAA